MTSVDLVRNRFVPWLDDALLSEESCYSVICKAAWFTGHTPASFVAQCRTPDGEEKVNERSLCIAFADWYHELPNARVQPWVHGKSMVEHLYDRNVAEARLFTKSWRSPWLRICIKCIERGVHLSLHQHLAVHRCPVHRL